MSDSERLRALSEAATERNDHALAAYLTDELLSIEPQNPKLWGIQGSNYTALGRWAEAEHAFTTAIGIEPRAVIFRVALADVYYRQELWDLAEEALNGALDLDPYQSEANILLGRILYIEGKLNESERCLRTAIATNPENEDGFLFLGDTLRAQGRPDKAIWAYREALRIDPERVDALKALQELQDIGDQKRGHCGSAEDLDE